MKNLKHFKELLEAQKGLDYSKLSKLTVTNSDGSKTVHTASDGSKTVAESKPDDSKDTKHTKKIDQYKSDEQQESESEGSETSSETPSENQSETAPKETKRVEIKPI